MASDTPPPLRYNSADSERAAAVWKATCGPHTLAAACGLSLDDVRALLVGYKGWMNPTQMADALGRAGKSFCLTTRLKTSEPCEGINRIQWEGPWLNPGVPERIAYHHTHWIAQFRGWVLCTACEPAKWVRVEEWKNFHLNCEPRSPFHITHHYASTRRRPAAF